jgi:hypothetical protein
METQFTPTPTPYGESVYLNRSAHDSAVSWCAVFAGALASASLSLILLFLGTGLGFTLVSPWANEGISGTTFGVSSIVGITLISLIASAMGGYLAGRLRARWLNTPVDEVHFRDTAHGFLSWSLATLATATLLTTVVSNVVTGGVKAGAAVAGGLASTGNAALIANSDSDTAASDGKDGIGMSYVIDTLLRGSPNSNNPSMGQSTTMPQDPALAATEENTSNTTSTVPPQTEPRTFMAGNRSVTQYDDATKRELTGIFMQATAMGRMPQDDITYAAQLIAQDAGIDQQTAEQRVTDAFAKIQNQLEETETAVREAAEKARKATAYTSLWLFISLLCGAFVASLMAVYGGRQRDL